VLKPGGAFALIDPVRKLGSLPRNHHGLDVTTSDEVHRMLGEAGFDVLRSRVSFGALRAVARRRADA
jgi:hypothetical protein